VLVVLVVAVAVVAVVVVVVVVVRAASVEKSFPCAGTCHLSGIKRTWLMEG
jgi:hypothetical protein